MPREALPKYGKSMRNLRYWGDFWNIAHFAVGFSSAALAAVAAARPKFLTPEQSVAMIAISAGLMFVTTAFNPGKKGTAYQAASRQIKKAIALYESDEKLSERTLGDAIVQAEDILKDLK